MTTLGLALFCAYVGTLAFAWVAIRDLLSPDKLILVMIGLFFSDIFVGQYPALYQIIFLLLLAAVIAAIGAVGFRRGQATGGRDQVAYSSASSPRGSFRIRGGHHVLLWLLSVPALISQAYLISLFGGVEGYVLIVSKRVVEFQGLGPVIVTIMTIKAISILYFALVVNDREAGWKSWLAFGCHFVVFLSIALLSTSRGALLVNVVLMAVVYHYCRRPFRVAALGALVVVLLTVASVLGVMREGYRISDGRLVTGLATSETGERFRLSWMTYGLTPLRLVLEKTDRTHYLGATYLTAITNFVPRKWWPGKPDTGGVILTREYTDDAWGGYSHLATGILPEAIINFGEVGIVIGILAYAGIVVFSVRMYYRMKARLPGLSPLRRSITVVTFAYVMWGCGAAVTGEFTNIVVGTVISLFTVLIAGLVLGLMNGRHGRPVGAQMTRRRELWRTI